MVGVKMKSLVKVKQGWVVMSCIVLKYRNNKRPPSSEGG